MPIQGLVRHESVSVSTSAVGLTTITPGDGVLPNCAYITVEGAAIRFCADGTAATSSVGHAVEPNGVIVLTSRAELEQFSAISRDGGTATLKVSQGVDYVP